MCTARTASRNRAPRSWWRTTRSYFDPLAIGYLFGRRGRTVRFLGKKEVFDAPVVGDIATAMGGIRVDRGTGSEEPLVAAQEALAVGDMVAIMPQGTIPEAVSSSNRSSGDGGARCASRMPAASP